GIDPFADYETLLSELKKRGIDPYPGLEEEGPDGCLNLLLSHVIEPTLGQNRLFVLTHYPASQAALAQTTHEAGHLVAERFEVYFKGYELANGYHELADPVEQEKRLIEANDHRVKLKKAPLPIDTAFLAALKKGLPPCCGVAVGFDRLMMLRHEKNDIKEILPLDDF
ncbi:MAG: amino acid--tRNA ligase-related protein, partial [Parachlamydiaceae bacterium]